MTALELKDLVSVDIPKGRGDRESLCSVDGRDLTIHKFTLAVENNILIKDAKLVLARNHRWVLGWILVDGFFIHYYCYSGLRGIFGLFCISFRLPTRQFACPRRTLYSYVVLSIHM
jgi:hypothetical protein